MKSEAAVRLGRVTGWRWPLLLAVMLSGPPLMALTFSAIAPVLQAIAGHFSGDGDGVMSAQWVMTAPAIGLMLGGPVGGLLLDRIGPRVLMIGAFLLFAVAGSAGLWVNNLPALLIARFLLGFSGACVASVTTWLVGERFDDLVRRRMLGIQDSIAGVAAMSAVLLSGIAGAAGGWRLPFAIYLVAAPLVLFAWLSVPAITVQARVARSDDGRFPFGRLFPVYLLVLAMGGLMMLPATQIPFLLAELSVVDPVAQSRVIASSAAFAIVSAALYGRISGRLGEHGTFLAILLVYGCGTLLVSLSSSALFAAFGCMFLGMGTGLFPPHFANLLIGRTLPEVRGRAIGLMYGTIFLSEFLNPAIMLPLRRTVGAHGGFLVLSAVLFLGALAQLARMRRRAGS